MLKYIIPKLPWATLATITTFLLFSEMYVKIVVPVFNFGGMIYNPRDYRFFEIALLAFTSLLLPSRIKNPSDLYSWLYFGVLLIPSAVLSAEQGNDRFHLFLMFVALWLLMGFRKLFAPLVFRRIYSGDKNYTRLPYTSVFGFVIVILVFLAVSVHGAFNLNFEKVYDIRFDFNENMPLALRYLLPLASGTLVGFLGAMCSHRRDAKGLLLLVITGILFYGFSSHKAMLFNPFVAIAGYFILKISRAHLLMLAGFCVMTVITLLLPEDGFKLLGSMFANRVVFIPSQINFFYLDFFTVNSFMFWAESKISLGLVASELPMAVMNYIGGMMTGNYDIGANTGWMANAYMNAGIFGIIIYAGFIGVIFAFIDFWAKVYGKQLVGAAFLVPINTLITSADLLIVLLTAGLFVLLVVFHITTIRIRVPKRTKNHISVTSNA